MRTCKALHVYTYGTLNARDDLSKSFVLFAQGRTGSTLLGSLLNSHPDITFEDEILNIDGHYRPYAFPYLYSMGRKKKSGARSYGYHVKIYQLSRDHNVDPKTYIRRAHADGWKIIYLKRTNLLRHALSNIKAERTSTYFHYQGKTDMQGRSATLIVEPEDLIWRMEERETFLRQEADILSGIASLDLEYEKDLIEPHKQQDSCRKIFDFLGMEAQGVEVSSNLKRINQGSLHELISNIDQLRSSLQGTRFEDFLEEAR